jgi:hypothetical protein
MRAVAVVAALFVIQLPGQVPRFGTETSLVRLDVSVLDARGPVRGLRAEDFVVIDNGVRQTVTVEEAADVPLDLALVVPPLPAVRLIAEDQVARVSAALSALLHQVEDRDRASVILAGAPPTRLRGLENGPPSFGLAVFERGADAAPFDAIAAGIRDIADPTLGRRRALIAFTNAADARSTVSFDMLVDAAQRADIRLVLVGTLVRVEQTFGISARTTTGTQIGDPIHGTVSGLVFPARLQQLAKRTGGVAVNLGSADPAVLIADILDWLRTRYVLSYTPPAGKGWHTVGVSVNRRDVQIFTRDGYCVD